MSLGIDEYGPSTYGDRIAEFYDAWFHPPTDTQAAVDFMANLAMSGPALELAIGTGRIALPLAAKGGKSMGSTHRRPWWPSSGRSRAAPTS